MKRILIVIILISSTIASCNRQSKTTNDPEETLIRSARRLSNEAIAKKDTAVLASVWTLDYHLVTSRNFERSGRIANRDWFANEYNSKPDVIYVRTPETIQVFSSWNMASESGTWEGHWTENGEPCELSGSYFAKWHKINGRWMIRAEVFVPLSCSGKFCAQSPI